MLNKIKSFDMEKSKNMNNINKKTYWLGLLMFFSAILIMRYSGVWANVRPEFFYVIAGLWICLILFPLFGEIEFMGIRLKREFEYFKKEVQTDIKFFKADISQSVNQQIYIGYGPVPAEKKIDELEKEVKSFKEKYNVNNQEDIDGDKLSTFAKQSLTGLDSRFIVSEEILTMFSIRYTLESLLANVWNNHMDYYTKYKADNPVSILQDLKTLEIIDADVHELTRAVLAISNSVIHGKAITEKQKKFVMRNSRLVYDTLRKLGEAE